MQTEKPYWLSEAYNSAITSQDVGVIQRNLATAKLTKQVILSNFKTTSKFLDWGGGYGLFTRLMRDMGFDYYHRDPNCKNLFASRFEGHGSGFELITAFEVLEHLEDPVEAFKDMFTYGDSILFTQELIPKTSINNWWYLSPEHGQHIAFYSEKSLSVIAEKMHANIISKNNVHLMTKKRGRVRLYTMRESPIRRVIKKIINRFNYHILRRPRITPLTGKDFRESRGGQQ